MDEKYLLCRVPDFVILFMLTRSQLYQSYTLLSYKNKFYMNNEAQNQWNLRIFYEYCEARILWKYILSSVFYFWIGVFLQDMV